MKPFDLEKALAGEPVVTRDGRPVTQVTKFDAPNDPNPVVAVIDGDTQSFTLTGAYFGQGKENEYDLFMATKTVKKEGWVNLYRSFDGECTIAANSIYSSKTEALHRPQFAKKYIATVKIEWEEEI